MRNQVALVVQQLNMMKSFLKDGQLPKFNPTSSLNFGDRYVVSYDSDARDWFDLKKAYITGYDHTTNYGNVYDLLIELFESHGINMDFAGDIPVGVLECVEETA